MLEDDDYCGCCGGPGVEPPRGEHDACCRDLHYAGEEEPSWPPEDWQEVTIRLPQAHVELLEVLCVPNGQHSIRAVLSKLADHAQQGVYRPGSWERGWLIQAFGDDWLASLEPDDAPGRLSADGGVIFDRPRSEPG